LQQAVILFHFIAVPPQKVCKKLGSAYANYFRFRMHDEQIIPSGNAR